MCNPGVASSGLTNVCQFDPSLRYLYLRYLYLICLYLKLRSKLLLENALATRPWNYGAASEPLLPKVALCIPVLSSRYIGKCAARVLKHSDKTDINSVR